MIIKVCGICDRDNLIDIIQLPIDWVGVIFYDSSSRHVESNMAEAQKLSLLNLADSKIKKVGVFVNEAETLILEKAKKYDLSFIQLHGIESVETCKKIKESGLSVVKAFAIGEEFDFKSLEKFVPYCDYFLFDTKGKLPGGNGYTFNWEILKQYHLETPFLLSGGIGPEHVDKLSAFCHPKNVGLDLNSKFEIRPGVKDVIQLKEFIDKIRAHRN